MIRFSVAENLGSDTMSLVVAIGKIVYLEGDENHTVIWCESDVILNVAVSLTAVCKRIDAQMMAV